MNEKGRQTKLLAAIAVLVMVMCAIAVVLPSDNVSGDIGEIGSDGTVEIGTAEDLKTILLDTESKYSNVTTIVATNDIEMDTSTFDSNSFPDATVDLNGKTIDMGTYTLTINGLTVSNGDVTGTGADTHVYGDQVIQLLNNSGLKDVDVSATINDTSKEFVYAAVLINGTPVTISGGSISGEIPTGATTYGAIQSNGGKTVTLDGVTINGNGIITIKSNDKFTFDDMPGILLNFTSNISIGTDSVVLKGTSTIAETILGWEEGNSSLTQDYTNTLEITVDLSGESIDFGTVRAGNDGYNDYTSTKITVSAGSASMVGGTSDLVIKVESGASISAENYIANSIEINGTATISGTAAIGSTFAVGSGATINVPAGQSLNLENATNTATDTSWTLNVGADSTVTITDINYAPNTVKAANINSANVVINGVTQEFDSEDQYTPTVNSQETLEEALAMGTSTITISADGVDITKNLVIDYPVTITVSTETNAIDISEGASISFTNGGHYDGYVSANGTVVDIDLTGSFTLGYGSVVIKDLNGTNPVTSTNVDGDMVTVESGDVVEITGALNSKLTINADGGSIILKDLNITSSGSIYFNTIGNAKVTSTGTVSVYGQIMTADDVKVSIDVGSKATFRAYGGSVIKDTVTVKAADGVTDAIINLDGAMHTLTINDDINSSNTYGQTQTVVIGSTLDVVSGTTVIIQGQFVVNDGVTLTIQSGAVLKISGTTSVMDVNGNIIINDGGKLVVENSQAVDIAGSVQVYGTMDVQAGKVTVQEGGNVTVAVDGELIIVSGTTVKTGATVDILGGFYITAIENAGTISMTGAIMNQDSNVTLKNGGELIVNSYTVATANTKLTVTDGQNSIVFTASAAKTGFSGAVITTASVKDADNNNAEVFTMSVSGSIGAVDSTGENDNADYYVDISGNTTVDGAKVAVSGDLTVGEDVTVTNKGKLEVSGTVTATAGIFTNSGTIDITGTVTVTGNATLGGTVNAAYCVTTVTTGTNAGTTTTYTTFENAVQSGATRITVGVGSATVVVTGTVTVPGTVTNVTVSSNATLQVGATDNRDIIVTVSDGARVTGKIVVYATLTFDNNRNDNAAVTSDVVINDEPARTYTNLYTALASGAETVTLAGPVVLTSNITVPVGTTLVVPAGTGVAFNEGVTMTVNGAVQTAVDFTCLADKDGNTVTFTDKTASTTDNTAKIVVNGKFMNSVTGRTDAGLYALYKIAGAYYDISNSTGAFTVIAPVATAAAEDAADIVDGSIVVYGEVSMGDVAFNGTEDDPLFVDVFGKSTGNVTMTYATLDLGAQFTGSVSTAVGSIKLVNVSGIVVESAFVEEDGADVEYMYVSGTATPVDPKVNASMTVASGNVTVKEQTAFTIEETTKTVENKEVVTNAVAFDIASGATLTVNGTVDVYDVTVDGTLISIDNGKITADVAYVFGTLTVAETDIAAEINAGTAEIATLYVGLDNKYDNLTAATLNGQVGGVKLMVVASEATVSEEFLEDFTLSTAFNVEGSVWFTAYASGNSTPVTVDNVKVDNALFVGWAEEQDGDAIVVDKKAEVPEYVYQFAVGQYETLYAVIDYDIYNVYITADGGIGTVAIDGKVLVKVDNVFYIEGLTAGTHTIDYIVNSGFEGTPTISVNGTAISGNTFTLSGTSASDMNVQISIYGTQPAAPGQGGSTSDGDSGMGLTDYLLIILVVLIAVMAIIVAMRLMRS